MENEGIKSLIDLIERIEITEENSEQISQIKKLIEKKEYTKIIEMLNELKEEGKIRLKNKNLQPIVHNEEFSEKDFKEIFQEELE